MPKPLILAIEDEKDLLKVLKYNLERNDFEVLTATNGEAGLTLARQKNPSLILLDLMLPGMNGFEVCRAIRQTSNVPILMLTAKNDEYDKVIGLELGADDYLTKPFGINELIARIKTILRRTQPSLPESSLHRFGDFAVDFARYSATVKGKPVRLNSKEFEFLKVLVEARGHALHRDELLEKIWGLERSMDIDTRTIDQHIARLRDKLGKESRRVVTVKKVGYRFDID